MKNWNFLCLVSLVVVFMGALQACSSDESEEDDESDVSDYIALLTHQFDEVLIPTMESYQTEITNFENTLISVASTIDEATLATLRQHFESAYLAYQSAAVHDYFSTSTVDLVELTNLYPIEISTLDELITSESRAFEDISHARANGFPAIDYMLYGPDDVLTYLNEDTKRIDFLKALISDMKSRSDELITQWNNLREPFISSDGTGLGSAISSQLNGSLSYYEFTVREDKVGIPIGRVGPNDSPIDPDATKIEAYYHSLASGNEDFTLLLVQTAVEEMEDIYLGSTSSGTDGQGYDDLLAAREQTAIDSDIKAQFATIYAEIGSRGSINSEDNNAVLYNAIQGLVTLYKSDLFPILNIQDADGANDGD